ncbi:hypothetical protein V8E53_012807, partial [Lactarius tabidus]
MISSKWIADALGPDGIYASWIALRQRTSDTWKYHGFPVTLKISSSRVTEPFLSETGAATHIGSFAGAPQGSDSADLSPLLEDAMQSRKEVSLELVNLRHIMFAQAGRLMGMITKTDIVALSTAHLQRKELR